MVLSRELALEVTTVTSEQLQNKIRRRSALPATTAHLELNFRSDVRKASTMAQLALTRKSSACHVPPEPTASSMIVFRAHARRAISAPQRPSSRRHAGWELTTPTTERAHLPTASSARKDLSVTREASQTTTNSSAQQVTTAQRRSFSLIRNLAQLEPTEMPLARSTRPTIAGAAQKDSSATKAPYSQSHAIQATTALPTPPESMLAPLVHTAQRCQRSQQSAQADTTARNTEQTSTSDARMERIARQGRGIRPHVLQVGMARVIRRG